VRLLGVLLRLTLLYWFLLYWSMQALIFSSIATYGTLNTYSPFFYTDSVIVYAFVQTVEIQW
jgi:hypothetical protein